MVHYLNKLSLLVDKKIYKGYIYCVEREIQPNNNYYKYFGIIFFKNSCYNQDVTKKAPMWYIGALVGFIPSSGFKIHFG